MKLHFKTIVKITLESQNCHVIKGKKIANIGSLESNGAIVIQCMIMNCKNFLIKRMHIIHMAMI